MSFWGATVITNLLSAIPVFGQDLVELIWISGNLENLNLIIISAAGKEQQHHCLQGYSTLLTKAEEVKPVCNSKQLLQPCLSLSPLRGVSKEDSKEPIFKSLETIGIINWGKLRGAKPITEQDKKRLLAIPIENLARLAGLIDGDGFISVAASDAIRRYATVTLKIGLHYTELPLLIGIQKELGIGRINGPYTKPKGENVVYLVFNKT
jgi:hypothetical protein